MKMTIEINMDNAAFGDEPEAELSHILHELAYKLEDTTVNVNDVAFLRDSNGNRVGKVTISE